MIAPAAACLLEHARAHLTQELPRGAWEDAEGGRRRGAEA